MELPGKTEQDHPNRQEVWLLAGLSNTLWLRPGRVVLQLIPYGWERSPAKITGYEQLAKNVNCTHLLWRNMHPENGFFDERHFKRLEQPFHQHPNEAEVLAGAQYNSHGQMHGHYLYQVIALCMHFEAMLISRLVMQHLTLSSSMSYHASVQLTTQVLLDVSVTWT